MWPFEGLLADKRKVVAAAAIVVLAALAVRFLNIGWSFSNNGIDEGVMAERALLVSMGFDLYSEVPCDQAPLAFLMGAALDGDVVALRSLSAAMSVLAVIACMLAARRMQGDAAMLVTGALLALDFAFLRESRLFSLDGMSAYFLAFSILAFLGYARGRSRLALASAGVLVGLSTAVKLFGGLAFIGILVFMVLEGRRNRMPRSALATDLSILAVSALAPMAVLLLALGPGDMIQGMVFDQGGREFDAFLKLSLIAFFGVNPAYALPLLRARTMWGGGPEVRFLLVVTIVILAAMIVQPLSFLHHMVLLSPGLSVLAGFAIGETVSSKKGSLESSISRQSSKSGIAVPKAIAAVFLVNLLIGAGFASYGLSRQGEPPSSLFASYVQVLTGPDDYIVTGDPLIATLAGRMVPPELVNMAYRVGDLVTEEEVEAAIVAYDVGVVVVCYRLAEMPGLEGFLAENGFTALYGLSQPATAGVLDLFQEGELEFTLYARG